MQGSRILQILLITPQVSSVLTISRRPLEVQDPKHKLHAKVDANIDAWPANFGSPAPCSDILFSGLGTTRGAAGSFANQRKIDYDSNLAIARAAKDAGIRTYVLISANGASSQSYIAYSKMKGELEEAITALGFEKAVFVRPGFLIGKRPSMKFRESQAQAIATWLGRMSGGRLKDVWAQDANVVARAAASAGVLASEGKAPEGKVWNLSQADIVRSGRLA